MNWYLLHLKSLAVLPWLLSSFVGHSRYHFLKAPQRGLNIVPCCNVVLHFVDKRGIGNAPRVGGCGIFAAVVGYQRLSKLAPKCSHIIQTHLATVSVSLLAMFAVMCNSRTLETWELGFTPCAKGISKVGCSPRWMTRWGRVTEFTEIQEALG